MAAQDIAKILKGGCVLVSFFAYVYVKPHRSKPYLRVRNPILAETEWIATQNVKQNQARAC